MEAAELSGSEDDSGPAILINEFLADNKSESPLEHGEILDGNGDSSDWIELYNPSHSTIDIGGWYLTDNSGLKTKWQFPKAMTRLVLPPGGYLLVFASGKTQAEHSDNYPYVDPAGYLHTNFKLSQEGEYLGLTGADGTTTIHAYDRVKLEGGEWGYPQQRENVSYGVYENEPCYLGEPTPGTANQEPVVGFVSRPDVSVKGGCYARTLDIILSCDTPGASIRYTTDGTAPSPVNGFTCDAGSPIYVDHSITLMAQAFKPAFQSSEVRIETYILVDPAVAAFSSNLPMVVIDTFGQSIPKDKANRTAARCQAVMIDTDEAIGRAGFAGWVDFEGPGQIQYRGESTYGQGRGQFAFEIQDEYGQDKDAALLGMPAESDWVLTSEVIDYTLLKCEVAFKWFRDMGHYAPRQRYVEVYLNERGGLISSDDYRGIFILREGVKRGKNRVDIARLDASYNQEPKVSGGYIIKSDKLNTGDLLLADYMEKANYGIQYTGAGKLILAEPGPLEVTVPQTVWIANYLNTVNAVLWQNTASPYYPGPDRDYADYIDVTSWIDHGIVVQICADADAFWGSYYTYKDRAGKICSGPPWDFDRSFHNNGSSTSGYTVWKTNGGIFGKWHQKLQQDPEYARQLADRWFEQRKGALNTEQTLAHIDAMAALISDAMDRTIAKYGWRGIAGTYADEIALFKGWISNRLNYLDEYVAAHFGQEREPSIRP